MAVDRKMIRSLWREMESKLAARGESWMPSRRKILGIPELLSCECFSSWVYRGAVSSHLPLKHLKGAWKVKVPTYWVDCGVADLDTGIIVETINHGDVAAIEASRWPPFSYLASRRGLCLTTEPLSCRPIYRYCVQCLVEDERPYIRKAWRLACSYVCTEHGTLLREQCPACGVRIDLSLEGKSTNKIREATKVLQYCQHCGADLCDVEEQDLPPDLFDILADAQLKMQLMIFDASAAKLKMNSQDNQLYTIVSPDYLNEVMRQIMMRGKREKAARYPWALEEFTARFFYMTNRAFHAVYAGVHGVRLFRDHADQIQNLFERQGRSFESTFWIPPGKVAKLPLNEINSANTWLNKVLPKSRPP